MQHDALAKGAPLCRRRCTGNMRHARHQKGESPPAPKSRFPSSTLFYMLSPPALSTLSHETVATMGFVWKPFRNLRRASMSASGKTARTGVPPEKTVRWWPLSRWRKSDGAKKNRAACIVALASDFSIVEIRSRFDHRNKPLSRSNSFKPSSGLDPRRSSDSGYPPEPQCA